MSIDSESPAPLGRREHNEAASAKRVVSYYQNGDGDWVQVGVPIIPNTDYDYIDVQQTSSTVDTFVYKTGGSGGTTVQTITVTYTDTTKNDIDSVAWS